MSSAYNPDNVLTALNANQHLARPRVLVTRPAQQAEAFCALLLEAGCEPVRCPTVEIAPIADTQLAREQLTVIRDSDVVIFTSANAVRSAASIFPLQEAVSKGTKLLAVGPATAAALHEVGLDAAIPTGDFSSQGLLSMPELQQIAQQTVLLVRGRGGLATLPNAIEAAGAKLHVAEVYQRQIPANGSILKQLFHSELPQIISSTSNESLSNLVTLVPVEERPRLWHIPVIVNSERGEQLAHTLGFSGDILRASPVGDYGQINTLKAWITQRLTQR